MVDAMRHRPLWLLALGALFLGWAGCRRMPGTEIAKAGVYNYAGKNGSAAPMTTN